MDNIPDRIKLAVGKIADLIDNGDITCFHDINYVMINQVSQDSSVMHIDGGPNSLVVHHNVNLGEHNKFISIQMRHGGFVICVCVHLNETIVVRKYTNSSREECRFNMSDPDLMDNVKQAVQHFISDQ